MRSGLNKPGRANHMTAQPQPLLDLCWFLPLFVGSCCTALCFLSFIGGWHALSKRYSSAAAISGRLFSFASVWLGPGLFPVSYSACLFVQCNADGIALNIFSLFRPFHPRLFIPWNVVAGCKRQRYLFFNCTAVYLSEPRQRILFRGKAGREIYELWQQAAKRTGN